MSGHVKSHWETALLVCRKCSKRQKGGFGPKGKTGLAKALKCATGAKKGRKAALGIVEVDCLGVCPKHAVVLIDARDPQRWRLVKPGADIGDLLEALALPPSAEGVQPE